LNSIYDNLKIFSLNLTIQKLNYITFRQLFSFHRLEPFTLSLKSCGFYTSMSLIPLLVIELHLIILWKLLIEMLIIFKF